MVVEQRVFAHEAGAGALGVDTQDFLEGRVQKVAFFAHGEDVEDTLRWEGGGRGRDGSGFQFCTDVLKKGGVGIDVHEHIERRGDRVGEDAEQGIDLKAALVPGREVVLAVRSVSGSDHCGALRLAGYILFKVLLKCEAKG